MRRGIIISYCLGWLKPYENQWLTYPPEVASAFNPELAALVGYQQHRPNLGNYDGQCPSILLGGDPPDHLAAIDALRPDQEGVSSGRGRNDTLNELSNAIVIADVLARGFRRPRPWWQIPPRE